MHIIVARATLLAVALSVPSLQVASAQGTRDTVRSSPRIRVEPGMMSLVLAGAADRAVLGVTLATSTRGDTSGIRIDAVDSAGPAAKAGLKSGDVITEINGVSLRVSRDDADDPAMTGVTQRRLQRTLAKAKPGDEVELRVRSGNASRLLKVHTVSAADLERSRERRVFTVRTNNADDNDQRGAIGVSIGGSGSVRDTLGLFVSSVTSGGPAEQAGIVEGERVAAVNGVDVRVAKEDVEDQSVASSRVNRFVREVQRVAPGGAITLRVYGNGRYRDVSMKAVKMSEMSRSGVWDMSGSDGGVRIIRRGSGGEFDIDGGRIERSMEMLRERMQHLGRDFQLDLRELPRTKDGEVIRLQTLPRRGLTSR